MEQVVLSIEYSPILRERLTIKKNGSEVPKDTGAWQKVFNNLKTEDGKYNFLQEVGLSFFDSLYEACYGKIQGETLLVDMQTTEEVFKDFQKMAEWYTKNNKNQNKIVVRQLTKQLIANESIAKNIEEIASNLENYLNNQIKELKNFNKKVFTAIENGIKNIDNSLTVTSDDNIISVCVTGVYSSGKSTFINALLGDDVLESNDDPSTAAIFSIKKIKENEKKSIEFSVISPEVEHIILQWEEGKLKPATKIANQTIINDLLPNLTEDKTLAEQFQFVGAYINEKIKASADEENNKDIIQIEPNVTIYYPFKLGGNIPVKICDTPGTNSSYKDDGEIIQKALNNQKNSILITLLIPIKSDDRAGNNILFNTIDDAEQNNAYLDKSRIFFIWNQIDGDYSDEDGVKNKKNKIITIEKDENNTQNIKSINLAEYPLFFMSSKRALSAQKLLVNPEDKKWLKKYRNSDVDINLSQECSLGWQTESIHNKAEKVLKAAGDDEYKQALVMSGLYSVQNGITDYINKYASAIIANGRYRVIGDIIDDLNSVLAYEKDSQKEAKENASEKFQNTKMELKEYVEKTCNSYIMENNVERKDKELAELNNRIHLKIGCLAENFKGFHLKKTNEKTLREARISLTSFVNEVIEQQNIKVEDSINNVFQTITDKLQIKFEKSLPPNVWLEIKKEVYKEIKSNKNLKIPYLAESQFLWLYKLNKDDFKTKATQNVNEETASVRNSISNFNETRNAFIGKIRDSYLNNLEEYSQTLVRYKNDAEEEERKLQKLEHLYNEVNKYMNEIDSLIFN